MTIGPAADLASNKSTGSTARYWQSHQRPSISYSPFDAEHAIVEEYEDDSVEPLCGICNRWSAVVDAKGRCVLPVKRPASRQ